MTNEIVQSESDMAPVIERLWASKQRIDAEQAEQGEEVGREWARDHAEADELERLSKFSDGIEREQGGWDGLFHMSDGQSAYGPSEIVAFAILGDDGDRSAASDFWEAQTGHDRVPLNAFVKGFVDGALEVWGDVKDKI